MIINRKEIVFSNCEICKILGCGVVDCIGIGRELLFFINIFKVFGVVVFVLVCVRFFRFFRYFL